METLVALQHWLYGGMASNLGEVAGGEPTAMFVAMAAALSFGFLHALMPGHGKTVLISYHIGQPARFMEALANGAILALTHVGLAVLLVLAGFAIISNVFSLGGRTPHFEIASGLLITMIGAFLLWRSLGDHDHAQRGGKSLAIVTGMIPCPLTTFVMSYALSRGMLGAGLAVTAAMAVGMIATIAGVAICATLARHRFMSFLAGSEQWRHRIGTTLQVAGASAVLGLAF